MNAKQTSNASSPQGTDKKRSTGALFWMLFPIALLVISVSGWLVMVSIAVDDPGFALEADYYKKANDYDSFAAQRGENERLGWRISLESFEQISANQASIIVRIVDQSGHAIDNAEVNVTAFPNDRAYALQELKLRAGKDGTYTTAVSQPRLGLWEMRFVAEKMETFTQIVRAELKGPAMTGPPA